MTDSQANPSLLPQPKRDRLVSLDALRGLLMLAMVSDGLRLAQVAKTYPDSTFWRFLGYQSEHTRWQGCAAWDLIMPGFMFVVGVALPFSLAGRRAKGEPWPASAGHALYRSVFLVLLGIFLFSDFMPRTNFTFINVLCQIGLGYTFVFLLAHLRPWTQLLAVAAILAGYWVFFYRYPLPAPGFDYAAVGVPADWPHLTGLPAHWDLNTNVAAAFDQWFLNLFPRAERFRFREGGGSTLNFIPAIATMTLGVLAGQILRSSVPDSTKCRRLVLAGLACLAVGVLLDPAILPFVKSTDWTLCPIVKRLWTPSWAVYSAGWAFWMLAGFYWIIEMHGYRRWAFPLVVVGLNSIAMYCMASLSKGWVRKTLKIHLGQDVFAGTYGPILESLAVLFILWLVCLWMYRRRIFLKI